MVFVAWWLLSGVLSLCMRPFLEQWHVRDRVPAFGITVMAGPALAFPLAAFTLLYGSSTWRAKIAAWLTFALPGGLLAL